MPFKAPTNRLPSSSSQVAPGQSSASTAPMTRPMAIRRIKLVSLYFLAIDLTAEVNEFMKSSSLFCFFMAAGAMPAAACRTAEPRMYPLYKDKNRKTRGALMWLRCFCVFFAERTTKNVEKCFRRESRCVRMEDRHENFKVLFADTTYIFKKSTESYTFLQKTLDNLVCVRYNNMRRPGNGHNRICGCGGTGRRARFRF